MKYQGNKQRIAKHILPIILENKEKYDYYLEPFCGALGTMDKVKGIKKTANDYNPFLIAMWIGLQVGFNGPIEIPKQLYDVYRNKYNLFKSRDKNFENIRNNIINFSRNIYRNNRDKITREEGLFFSEIFLTGWIGYMASYNGRFFDGGYSGKTDKRDYINEQIKNTLKQVDLIKDTYFMSFTYEHIVVLQRSIVYCDPPYKNTKEYEFSKNFDHERFYNWCRNIASRGDCKIFISEYEMPEDFKCVWEMKVTNSMHQTKTKKPVERLFTI